MREILNGRQKQMNDKEEIKNILKLFKCFERGFLLGLPNLSSSRLQHHDMRKLR